MHYTRLTPAQSAEIEAGYSALLTTSRERHADHIARQAADRANVANVASFGQTQLDQAKALLASAHAKHQARRFTGEPITGFGALA
jgi:hypothetical protein